MWNGGGEQESKSRTIWNMEERIRKKIEGMNMIRVHYMHGWKCHSENPYPVQLLCTNRKHVVLPLRRKNIFWLTVSKVSWLLGPFALGL
jgi:hypothetical protein